MADLQSPCLIMDLAMVRKRYQALREALPDARICYAVKANPMPAVVGELVALGASFDVASPGEIRLCRRLGADPERLSYGNTIKKREDIRWAYEQGVRLFATDSEADLWNLAEYAPGSHVFCRVAVDDSGSQTPFGRKFGCSVPTAVDLLRKAREWGLDPYGVSFHMGSQQLDPRAWQQGIAAAGRVFEGFAEFTERAGEKGLSPRMVNLGGGLPARHYVESPATLSEYALIIEQALETHFSTDFTQRPEVLVEPGRFLVADAGVLRSQVVLITPEESGESDAVDSGDAAKTLSRRWVYLDISRYNGLAETEGEAITYRLRTPKDGEPTGPVVLAGPTCDGDDVLYQHTEYALPANLAIGDWVDILSAGAYTASYASVGFNGFDPLATYAIDSERDTSDTEHILNPDSENRHP